MQRDRWYPKSIKSYAKFIQLLETNRMLAKALTEGMGSCFSQTRSLIKKINKTPLQIISQEAATPPRPLAGYPSNSVLKTDRTVTRDVRCHIADRRRLAPTAAYSAMPNCFHSFVLSLCFDFLFGCLLMCFPPPLEELAGSVF
jgi:hypothetical protein